jgi:hypothetical protein
VSTIHSELLWCDGGWPGSCHEHEPIALSGLGAVLDTPGVTSCVTEGFGGLARLCEHCARRSGSAHHRSALYEGGPGVK